jgi:flagellar motor switch protein FliN/FliY
MTSNEALIRLATSTGAAIEGVLSMLVGDAFERGEPSVVPEGTAPLHSIAVPAVATNVSYVDGVRGGNVFVVTALGARRLAALMMGEEPPEAGESELTELELSAVGEAMNQMMAAAAAATGTALGQEVEIGAPETHFFPTEAAATDAFDTAPYAVSTTFVVCGEPARFVQLVPQAFVVQITRALADLDAEAMADDADDVGAGTVPGRALTAVPVRVSAELGRFRMGIGRAVGLPAGSVVTLDAPAEDPVALLVNGRLFGRGRLLVGEDGEWAVRVEELVPAPSSTLYHDAGGGE